MKAPKATMYDIEIDYSTGSSFHNEEVRGESIGFVVTDLEMAKTNLARIKAHYLECKNNPNFGREYELDLLTDTGPRTIRPFWIGYFEQLHGATIVTETDTDLQFTV